MGRRRYADEPRFRPARLVSLIRHMLEDGFDTFVEIGPHPMLSESILETAATMGKEVRVHPTIRRYENDLLVFEETLDALKTQHR